MTIVRLRWASNTFCFCYHAHRSKQEKCSPNLAIQLGSDLDRALVLVETPEPVHVDERLALVVLVVEADETVDLSLCVLHHFHRLEGVESSGEFN